MASSALLMRHSRIRPGGSTPVTPPVTPPSSGIAMPTTEPAGFTRVWDEDFNVDFPVGSFVPSPVGSDRLVSSCAAYNRFGNKMGFYPDNQFDTDHVAKYYTSKTVSTKTGVANANGVLDTYLHTETINGVPTALSSWFRPYLPNASNELVTYGRFSCRIRADYAPGFGGVFLTIADNWPAQGELDWPEGEFDGGVLGGFYHYADPTNKQLPVTAASSMLKTDWHVATIEWTPGRVRWLIDDQVFLNTTDRVPSAGHKHVYQCGGSGRTPAANVTGHVQIDWWTVAAYTG